VKGFFDRILRTVCQGWIGTVILLISASGIARIISVNHQRLVNSLICELDCKLSPLLTGFAPLIILSIFCIIIFFIYAIVLSVQKRPLLEKAFLARYNPSTQEAETRR
jgi:hypothetical protein